MTCHTTFPCWHLHFATSKYQMDLIQSTVELDWTHSLTDVSNRWYGKTFLRQKLICLFILLTMHWLYGWLHSSIITHLLSYHLRTSTLGLLFLNYFLWHTAISAVEAMSQTPQVILLYFVPLTDENSIQKDGTHSCVHCGISQQCEESQEWSL